MARSPKRRSAKESHARPKEEAAISEQNRHTRAVPYYEEVEKFISEKCGQSKVQYLDEQMFRTLDDTAKILEQKGHVDKLSGYVKAYFSVPDGANEGIAFDNKTVFDVQQTYMGRLMQDYPHVFQHQSVDKYRSEDDEYVEQLLMLSMKKYQAVQNQDPRAFSDADHAVSILLEQSRSSCFETARELVQFAKLDSSSDEGSASALLDEAVKKLHDYYADKEVLLQNVPEASSRLHDAQYVEQQAKLLAKSEVRRLVEEQEQQQKTAEEQKEQEQFEKHKQEVLRDLENFSTEKPNEPSRKKQLSRDEIVLQRKLEQERVLKGIDDAIAEKRKELESKKDEVQRVLDNLAFIQPNTITKFFRRFTSDGFKQEEKRLDIIEQDGGEEQSVLKHEEAVKQAQESLRNVEREIANLQKEQADIMKPVLHADEQEPEHWTEYTGNEERLQEIDKNLTSESRHVLKEAEEYETIVRHMVNNADSIIEDLEKSQNAAEAIFFEMNNTWTAYKKEQARLQERAGRDKDAKRQLEQLNYLIQRLEEDRWKLVKSKAAPISVEPAKLEQISPTSAMPDIQAPETRVEQSDFERMRDALQQFKNEGGEFAKLLQDYLKGDEQVLMLENFPEVLKDLLRKRGSVLPNLQRAILAAERELRAVAPELDRLRIMMMSLRSERARMLIPVEQLYGDETDIQEVGTEELYRKWGSFGQSMLRFIGF